MNRDKEFVPYQPSLDMKELGFDEPCICGYSKSNEKLEIYSRFLVTKDSFTVDAPTFSQAFRWFREKYTLYSIISTIMHTYPNLEFYFKIQGLNDGTMIDKFNTYEEAELECLIKLIEIVKNK
jgi:hypothetical protein